MKKDEVPKTYEALLDPQWKGGKDVEPKPARLFLGYQRIVEKPDDYKYFPDNVKLYQEIFKTR